MLGPTCSVGSAGALSMLLPSTYCKIFGVCHLVSTVSATYVILCSHSGEQNCFCAVAVQLYFELSSEINCMCHCIAGCVWGFKFPQMRMRIGTAECVLLKSKRILQTKRRSLARRKWLHKTSYVNYAQNVHY